MLVDDRPPLLNALLHNSITKLIVDVHLYKNVSLMNPFYGATKMSQVRTGNAKKRMSVSAFVITKMLLNLAIFFKVLGAFI